MAIPWIVGIAALVLAARWAWVWSMNQARDIEFERRMRARVDLHKLRDYY